jgi:addiction module HigA family antidote
MANSSSVPPPMPGEELRKFLSGIQLKQDEVPNALGVSRVRLNEVLNGRRAITAETALKLSRVLGTSAEFWDESAGPS